MSFSKRPITFVSVKFAENRQRDVTLQTKRQVRTHTVMHENTNTKKILSMNLLRVLQKTLSNFTHTYILIKHDDRIGKLKRSILKCTLHPFEMYTRGYFCRHLKWGKKSRLKVAWLHRRNLIRYFNFLFFFFFKFLFKEISMGTSLLLVETYIFFKIPFLFSTGRC